MKFDSDPYGKLPPDQQALVSELLERFEELWKEGHRPRPEDWIAKVPADCQVLFRRELIRLELHYLRSELGEWPTPETLVADHPELRDDFLVLLGLEIGLASPKRAAEANDPEDVPAEDWLGHKMERDGKTCWILLAVKGRGAQANALLAYDMESNRQVIVKISRKAWPEAGTAQCRFLQEAQTLAGCRHANILVVYAHGVENGHPFLVTDYVAGPNLGSQFRRDRMDPPTAARVVSEIAQGVHVAHKNGVIHRDIKPENILLDEQIHPVLIDFGLACLSGSWTSPTDDDVVEVVGTPGYMAPEQLGYGDALIDARTDVFGLGGVLYFLATGKAPFPEGLSRPHSQFDDTALHESNFPAALIAICVRALSENPSDRFQSAAEMAQELQHWLDSSETPTLVVDQTGTAAMKNSYACNLFSRDLQDAKHIVGREGRLAEIGRWLNDDPNGGVYLVQGEPGIGKTGLMTKLVSSHDQCMRHFLRRGRSTGTPTNCLKNLIAQLLTQFSSHLTNVDFPSQSELDQQSLPQLQSTWFRLLQSVADQRSSQDRRVIVAIDALDELQWTGRLHDEHPLGFLDTLPPGIACVVSSRVSDETSRGSRYRLPFQSNPETRYEIGRNDPDHQAAVETYVEKRLAETRISDPLKHAGLTRDRFQAELIERAEFNFMYLHHVFREIVDQGKSDGSAHSMASLDLRRLPKGLTDYYRDHWERLWEHQDRNLQTLSVLVCLTNSEGQEWTTSHLSSVIGISPEELMTLLYDRWEPFLDRISLQQGSLAFYHRSYRDFLQENPVVQATFAAHSTTFDALAADLAMRLKKHWFNR